MSSDVRFERLVEKVLDERAPAAAPEELITAVLAATHDARRWPAWLARVRERPLRVNDRVVVGSPTLRAAYAASVAAIALVIGIGGVLGAASFLVRREEPGSTPTPTVAPTASPLPIRIDSRFSSRRSRSRHRWAGSRLTRAPTTSRLPARTERHRRLPHQPNHCQRRERVRRTGGVGRCHYRRRDHCLIERRSAPRNIGSDTGGGWRPDRSITRCPGRSVVDRHMQLERRQPGRPPPDVVSRSRTDIRTTAIGASTHHRGRRRGRCRIDRCRKPGSVHV